MGMLPSIGTDVGHSMLVRVNAGRSDSICSGVLLLEPEDKFQS